MTNDLRLVRLQIDQDGPNQLTIRDQDACTIARVEPRAAGASLSQKEAANLLGAASDMYAVLDDLEGVIDTQTYDEMKACDHDPPDDREFSVNLTAKQIASISRVLNKVKRGS